MQVRVVHVEIAMLPSTTDDVLFDNLSPADLLRYSRTSKTAYQMVSSYMRRAFNLQKLMDRFFTEIEMSSFRLWQSRTGMLISGSTALQFLDRTFYPESDLDIYVEHRYCKVIALWLISIGYTYGRARPGLSDQDLEEALRMTKFAIPKTIKFLPPSTPDYLDCGVAGVYNFHKADPDCKIQLVASHYSPVELILKFHSTCVMNLISHEKAYSLYPRGTFNERRSLIFHREGSSEEAAKVAREKYVARGWSMVEGLPQDEAMDPTLAFSAGSRYIGDSKCWTIPILPKLRLPEGYIEINSWNLLYDKANDAEMLFTILFSPTLRYSYLVKDVPLQRYILPALFSFTHDEQYVRLSYITVVKRAIPQIFG